MDILNIPADKCKVCRAVLVVCLRQLLRNAITACCLLVRLVPGGGAVFKVIEYFPSQMTRLIVLNKLQ